MMLAATGWWLLARQPSDIPGTALCAVGMQTPTGVGNMARQSCV